MQTLPISFKLHCFQSETIAHAVWLQRFASIHSVTRYCFFVPARRRSALTILYHKMAAFDAENTAANVPEPSIMLSEAA
ncbi:hypothetical protein [Roseovarius sp. ZX-A-9]|uniref:hypothetical protein n=1 Tax=Roseovarius sp. ZX-A-9 TaxID=3014783 RepID=UPI002330CF20|nr:hypothetical protein [Roseovarius sp. ZX-A-9]